MSSNARTRVARTGVELRLVLGALVAVGFIGCAGPVPLLDESGQDLIGREAYTLINLHPDPERRQLYTINYQLPGRMIPRCSKVRLLEMTSKALTFQELETGTEFQYVRHRAIPEPIEVSAARTFGPRCDPADAGKLSRADRKGIQEGEIGVGMSKEGVLLAAGHPPSHRTPSLESNEWTYWRNRFNTFIVRFNAKGIVTEIKD